MTRKILRIIVICGIFLTCLSAAPELFLLSSIIDAIGLDAFILLCEMQIATLIYTYFGQHIFFLLRFVNTLLQKVDPYYFIPNKCMLEECPHIVFHALPLLVGIVVVFYAGASVYA